MLQHCYYICGHIYRMNKKEVKTERLVVRCTPTQKNKWQRAADDESKGNLSQWSEDKLNEASMKYERKQ
jgi:hypothetical protein